MEHYGVPIDMEIFPPCWQTRRFGVKCATQWSLPSMHATASMSATMPGLGLQSHAALRRPCSRARASTAWPVTRPANLDMKDKVFREMAKAFPVLEPYISCATPATRCAGSNWRSVATVVTAQCCGRSAKTSRTQPKASQWIFSPAVWLRFLIKPEPGMALAYIDYSSAEFMIGASMSDGHCGPVNNMMDLYRSGDPYLNFAKRVGAIRPRLPRISHRERDNTKYFCCHRSTECPARR